MNKLYVSCDYHVTYSSQMPYEACLLIYILLLRLKLKLIDTEDLTVSEYTHTH